MKNDFLRTGYVMISRALLIAICEKQGAANTHEEAFLRVLIHANYQDTEVCYKGQKIICARGESTISFTGWSQILGWKLGRTRNFFERCAIDHLIEPVGSHCPSHIRILHYDAWTGQPAGTKESSKHSTKATTERNKSMEESLKIFIQRYSTVTKQEPESIGRLLPIWKRLSTAERRQAINGIEDYYFGLSNVKYCYSQAKYLEYKAFENFNATGSEM